jgi:hypothetical protein
VGFVGSLRRAGCPSSVSSDRTSSDTAATSHGADDNDRDHGTDRRDDDRADVQRTVDRIGIEQGTGQESADESADDAEDDVPDDAEALIASDEEAGQVASDRAEHDPCKDAHLSTSIPGSTNHPPDQDGEADSDGIALSLGAASLGAVLAGASVSVPVDDPVELDAQPSRAAAIANINRTRFNI